MQFANAVLYLEHGLRSAARWEIDPDRTLSGGSGKEPRKPTSGGSCEVFAFYLAYPKWIQNVD